MHHSVSRAQTLVILDQFTSAPSLFSAADPPLRIGRATFSGGQVLNAATFLLAIQSAVCGTAHFCSGCATTLVIDFEGRVSDCSMLLLNG
jgi:hypothetical protein